MRKSQRGKEKQWITMTLWGSLYLRQNISNWELRATSIPNLLSFTVCTWAVPLDSKFCQQQSVLTCPLRRKDAWQLRFKNSTSSPSQENWIPSEVNGVTCFIAFSGLWSRHKWTVLILGRWVFSQGFSRDQTPFGSVAFIRSLSWQYASVRKSGTWL